MNAPVRAKASRLPFRSKLVDWLKASPQKVASPQQWQGMLNNLQNVRNEEIEQAELTDLNFYYKPDFRIGKEEIIEIAECKLASCRATIQSHWKRAFRPTLDMKIMSDQLPKRVEAKARRFVEKAQTCYQHPSIGYWIVRTGFEDLATIAPNWIVLDHKGKMLLSHERHRGWFPTAIEAFDEMHRAIRKRFDEFGSERPSTLYDQYALMGGKNYQEWFICLPNWPLPYRDGHFGLKQLLVHIRTTERMGQDGQPLLMVEEIQSPWHADIRSYSQLAEEDKDENNAVSDAPFAKEWHELGIKAVIWLAIKQGFAQIGFTTGKQQCERWGKLDGLLNLYEQQIPKCLKKIASQYDCTNDWTTIVTRKPTGRIRNLRPGEWEVLDAKRTPISPPVNNKDVALFYLNSRSTPVKEQIRVLQVSDKLKQAMTTGGIPLFGW